MKTRRMISLTALLILISFVITTIISVISLNRVVNQNSADVTNILSRRISGEINDTLSTPITAARTIPNALLKIMFPTKPEDTILMTDLTNSYRPMTAVTIYGIKYLLKAAGITTLTLIRTK